MAFILSFALLSLLFPLALEVRQKGRDNVVSAAAREVAATRFVKGIRSNFRFTGELSFGLLGLVVLFLAIWLVFKLLVLFIALIRWIF